MERPKGNKLYLNSQMAHTSPFPSLKNKLSLFFLLLVGILSILKLSIHVLQTTPISQPYHGLSVPSALPVDPAPLPDDEEDVVDVNAPPTPDPEEEEFWAQPDDMGYRPCLKFSEEYVAESAAIVGEHRKYLMVIASGGLNQQRSQIIDAVVIARILGSALVVPMFIQNWIWKDESEFSDIFDAEHFKRVLADDVRVVSSLPPGYLMRVKPFVDIKPAVGCDSEWIRARYLPRIERSRVLLLHGIHSRLSRDLSPDLQKLRCKVAFHALRFTPRIEEIGNRLVDRMRSPNGRFLAVHLRMERDAWVRSGCLPELNPKLDGIIGREIRQHPEVLKLNMSPTEHKLAGDCPMTAEEVARLLKALGCPRDARIYWAGGEPYGGRDLALAPLVKEFPFLYNKENISLPGELEQFDNKASLLAAIDYVVALKSDVFMPSMGGNMGRILRGNRAFSGHKKHITPNKRKMMPHFLNASLSEAEFNMIIRFSHNDSFGQPRFKLPGKDVTAHPLPACMCNTSNPIMTI